MKTLTAILTSVLLMAACSIVNSDTDSIDFSECDTVIIGPYAFAEQEEDLWRYVFNFEEQFDGGASFQAGYSENSSLGFEKGVKYRVCLEQRPWPGRIDIPFIIGWEEF